MEAWKPTPIIKVYEALGTLGDGRIEVDGDRAVVRSSEGTKSYEVRYDAQNHAIMTNDNASYWQGYLGYPGIAYLMATGVITSDPKAAEVLAGFAWKQINTKFKNDWDKSEAYVRSQLAERDVDLDWLDEQLASAARQLEALELVKLGPRVRPPA